MDDLQKQNEGTTMTRIAITLAAILMLGGAFTGVAQAQDGNDSALGFDRVRGEVSPGAAAPNRQAMVDVIQSGTPEQIARFLEYGERVECHACVPLLERQLLENDDALVREMSAWWLRRHPFGFGAVFRDIRTVLANDADPVRRSRAAEALGEFMDPHGVTYLRTALADSDAGVRLAVVRGLGRINSPAGNAAIVQAFTDADENVRDAAVGQALYVNFFRDYDALLGRLADESATVRRRAALAIGSFRVVEAVPALSAMLSGESDRMVRQAAAFALGRIGGTEAQQALRTQQTVEQESLVSDAIDVALRM